MHAMKTTRPLGLGVLTVLLFGSLAMAALAADPAPDRSIGHPLLERAGQEMAANKDKLIEKLRTDILLTKLAILESRSDRQGAMVRARAIENPFYAALALGGIAATEASSAPSISVGHFREALARSASIAHYNGDSATSLDFLFQLPPCYPKDQAVVLLAECEQTLGAWKGADNQKNHALLSLCKSTASITPEGTHHLLDVAMKSHHYGASIEYLGTFMARQSLETALKSAEQRYQAARDKLNAGYFLRAVLLELARTDFSRAFEGIKGMQGLDGEIAAVNFAESMLAANRRKEAREVIDYVSSLKSEFNWTRQSLDRLNGKLAQDKEPPPLVGPVTPDMIDAFLMAPAADQLEAFAARPPITFKDKNQAREFVLKALPLADDIVERGYPYHGSPRSAALGMLMICSVLTGNVDQALEISARIQIPDLRIGYLMDSYEQVSPLPSIVSDWPIHFCFRKSISVQEMESPAKRVGGITSP